MTHPHTHPNQGHPLPSSAKQASVEQVSAEQAFPIQASAEQASLMPPPLPSFVPPIPSAVPALSPASSPTPSAEAEEAYEALKRAFLQAQAQLRDAQQRLDAFLRNNQGAASSALSASSASPSVFPASPLPSLPSNKQHLAALPPLPLPNTMSTAFWEEGAPDLAKTVLEGSEAQQDRIAWLREFAKTATPEQKQAYLKGQLREKALGQAKENPPAVVLLQSSNQRAPIPHTLSDPSMVLAAVNGNKGIHEKHKQESAEFLLGDEEEEKARRDPALVVTPPTPALQALQQDMMKTCCSPFEPMPCGPRRLPDRTTVLPRFAEENIKDSQS